MGRPGPWRTPVCGGWGPDGRVVWGVGLFSCDLQVVGSIPVATRSRDPPYHRGFGERDMIVRIAATIEFTSTQDYGRTLAKEMTHLKTTIIIY